MGPPSCVRVRDAPVQRLDEIGDPERRVDRHAADASKIPQVVALRMRHA
jgi:hypothetical protein